MTYYRVKEKYDNKKRYRVTKNGKRVFDGIFVGKELYTPKEAQKYFPCIYDMCDVVNIPKNHTYWFFGARFSSDGEGK